jgi:hypothetical protein
MKEQREYLPTKESFSPSGLQRAIGRAWPESTTSQLEKLSGPHLNAVITLCPLYGRGTLDESRVLRIGETSIDASRVANKWRAIQQVVSGVQDYAKRVEGSVSLTAVFANKGILLKGEPMDDDFEAIDDHDVVYKEVLEAFCEVQGITLSYHTYDDLGVPFPRFVNPEAQPPVEVNRADDSSSRSLAQLNALAERSGVPTQVTDNKKNRKILDKISHMDGITSNGVFWLVAGYLAFDFMLPDLVGENGFYVATERFEPLFGITNMTPGLTSLPKVKLKA